MNGKSITESDFYCTVCGRRGLMLPRRAGKQRNKGHIKHMWCIHCRQICPHLEVRDCDYTIENVIEILQQV